MRPFIRLAYSFPIWLSGFVAAYAKSPLIAIAVGVFWGLYVSWLDSRLRAKGSGL